MTRWALLCAVLALPLAIACSREAETASAVSPSGGEFVLAVSWEPGFCATAEGRDHRECKSMTADRYDATHFSLHGLWPDDLDDKEIYPCYCGHGAPVSCERSESQDQIYVSSEIFDRLRTVMPGTQSGLHRHEWTKHGSCYGDDPDQYFFDAMLLLDKLNASPLQRLFEERIGDDLSKAELESAFDKAFGEGAGDRVALRCSGRGRNRLIVGLDINMAGEIAADADLGALILAAPPTSVSSRATSCGGGRVTDAGR